jgi:acyl-CoA ligase (AMP-forming) (exosortase A-associated)
MKPTPLYTVCHLLAQHERTGTTHVALVDGEERVRYPELCTRVRRFAALLRARGVRRGDRVAIFLRRSADLVVAYLASHFAGAVAVVVNEKLRVQQVEYVLAHSGAVLLVTDGSMLQTMPELDMGSLELVTLDGLPMPAEGVDGIPVVGKDLAMIIYTSGSTGMPKGIMLSHQNLVEGALIVSDYLALSERDIVISLLPFTFDYGLNQLLSMLLVGGTLVIQRSLFPPEICKTLEREKVTGMAGVPLLWNQLASRLSPFLKRSFPYLRYATNTGGPFPQTLVPRFREAHPQVQLFLMYGLTEAFRSTYLPPDQVDRRPGSIGKAIPNVEILVVNERGEECAADEPGQLVHRGALVSLGYWHDPEATARVFRPHPYGASQEGREEIVVYSGDTVKRDAEGFLYFVGRTDQMIKSQGVRVSPEEIEHYIHSSGMVTAVVAFSAVNGNETAIVAAVIPREPASFVPAALEEFCRRELPEYMQPAKFWCLETFPETTSGKPDRTKLKDAYVGV